MLDPIRTAFVCGHPIAHSRSPKIHRFWLKQYGLAGNYEAIDVAPADFAAFAASIRAGRYVGGNVTIPHKEKAFRAVDKHDPAACEIGAVNTLWMAEGALWGANTDAYGFAANLDDEAPDWTKASGRAVILGAGGASRAVLFALKQRGFAEIRIVNRTVARAQGLALEFGAPCSAHAVDELDGLLPDASLLVNTTSVGLHGEFEVPIALERLPDAALVTDIVYVPLETPLLAAARRRGLKTVDGLGMLLHQAVPGFEKWFGVRPEVTPALRDLIVTDILAQAA